MSNRTRHLLLRIGKHWKAFGREKNERSVTDDRFFQGREAFRMLDSVRFGILGLFLAPKTSRQMCPSLNSRRIHNLTAYAI